MTPSAVSLAEARDALQPVRTALREHALRDAARLRADAQAAEAAELSRARADVDRILEQARDRGRRDGTAAAEAARAQGRREARALVLAAQREAYEELLRQVGERARQLGAEDEAIVQGDGNTLVRSLDDLAALALADLGTEVERLWGP